MRHQLAFIDIVSLLPRPTPRRTHRYARVPACGWGASSSPHSIFECKLVSNCAKSFAYARLSASLLLFLVLASCGYTIIQEKGIFQGEVISIDVPVFKNRSFEPQVSQFFTEAFTRELVTSGLFDVNKPDAPNILQGSIVTVSIVPTALDKNGLAIEKTVFVTAGFALSKKDGRLIKNWSLLDAEPYNVQDVNLEDPNKKEALKKIAARIARRFSTLVIADIDRKAL
jgi:hypothetical protein